jgi:hypothetical protein
MAQNRCLLGYWGMNGYRKETLLCYESSITESVLNCWYITHMLVPVFCAWYICAVSPCILWMDISLCVCVCVCVCACVRNRDEYWRNEGTFIESENLKTEMTSNHSNLLTLDIFTGETCVCSWNLLCVKNRNFLFLSHFVWIFLMDCNKLTLSQFW